MTLDVNDAYLKQITGCDRSAILQLEVILRDALAGKRARAPYSHSIRAMLVAALVKLRSGSAYRTISVHLGIPFVTLYRMTNLVCAILAKHSLLRSKDHDLLIVDVTCSRVRSTDPDDYSGYKHHGNRKVQVVVDNNRHIVAVPPAYSGKVHGKTIWNKEIGAVAPLLDRPTLADKAYAGAKSENVILFRPFKRNEKPYKTDREGCNAYNRKLSKIRVTVEHVFAQIKAYRIIRDIFPLRKRPIRHGYPGHRPHPQCQPKSLLIVKQATDILGLEASPFFSQSCFYRQEWLLQNLHSDQNGRTARPIPDHLTAYQSQQS